jgi:hypothetical protein
MVVGGDVDVGIGTGFRFGIAVGGILGSGDGIVVAFGIEDMPVWM